VEGLIMNRYPRVLGILALILLNLGASIYFLKPDWSQVGLIAMAAGVVTLIAFLTSNRSALTNVFLRVLKIKFLISVILLVIVGLSLPVFIELLSARYNYRLDLTENKRYTLAEQTRKILESLQVPVTAYVVTAETDPSYETLKDLMDRYAAASPNFQVVYTNPWTDPTTVKQYNVTTMGTVVLEANGRTKKVQTKKEADITNALVEVTSEEKKKVYFLKGHGERLIDNTEPEGLSELKAALRKDNYDVEELVLAQTGKVPDDCTVLVIAGPTRPFVDSEVMPLLDYVNNGGRVLFLPDTDTPDEVIDLFSTFGFKVGKDLVADLSLAAQLAGTNGLMPIITSVGYHDIVKNFGFAPMMVMARSVEADTSNPRIDSVALVYTSPESWAEKNLDQLEEIKYDEGVDKLGPISLGVASEIRLDESGESAADAGEGDEGEKEDRKARFVVFGDVDFVTNGYYLYPGNSDLVLNAVSWLSEMEQMIAMRPRESVAEPLFLTAAQQRFIVTEFVILLPLSIILIGIVAILPRRRQA
jgi:ABC-type uncharacterized transport system involved in gliding motility auxiliary subunit